MIANTQYWHWPLHLKLIRVDADTKKLRKWRRCSRRLIRAWKNCRAINIRVSFFSISFFLNRAAVALNLERRCAGFISLICVGQFNWNNALSQLILFSLVILFDSPGRAIFVALIFIVVCEVCIYPGTEKCRGYKPTICYSTKTAHAKCHNTTLNLNLRRRSSRTMIPGHGRINYYIVYSNDLSF